MSQILVSKPVETSSLTDEGFVQLLTKYQPDLQVFILGLSASRTDVDDILQEVNLALWRKRQSYRSEQDFRRWAFGFAMLEVRSFRTRTAKDRLKFSDATIEKLAADWSAYWQFADDQREALNQCLEKLGPKERNHITAFYSSGMTAHQIADDTKAPLSTVYKILTRARHSLRDCVHRSLAHNLPHSTPVSE
jgi:RNA polymerase sigma-70 factor (ECF subfamily)